PHRAIRPDRPLLHCGWWVAPACHAVGCVAGGGLLPYDTWLAALHEVACVARSQLLPCWISPSGATAPEQPLLISRRRPRTRPPAASRASSRPACASPATPRARAASSASRRAPVGLRRPRPGTARKGPVRPGARRVRRGCSPAPIGGVLPRPRSNP